MIYTSIDTTEPKHQLTEAEIQLLRNAKDYGPPGEAGHRTTQGSRDEMVQDFLNIARGMSSLVFNPEELIKLREEARGDYEAQFTQSTDTDKSQD